MVFLLLKHLVIIVTWNYSNPVTITSTGNISGSATSTGSFGDVTSVGTIRSSEIEVDKWWCNKFKWWYKNR